MALIGSITEGNSLVGSLNATGSLQGSIIGAKGDKGDKGDTGDTGNGIASITKTASSGLVDTYTITYTNGTTATFTVTNGADGTDGQDGQDGADGYSPSASVSKSGDTATVTITDKNGTTTATITDGQDGADGQDGQDGHSPVVTATKSGTTTTVYVDGSAIATIDDGSDGQDGTDGHSPVVTASKTNKVTTVYVDGVAIATINDGQDGAGSVADVTVDGVSVLDGTTAKVVLTGKANAVHTHVKTDITDFPSIPSATSTTPKMDGTASVGSETTWAKGDHVHPTDTSRAASSHTHTKTDITDFPTLATVATSGSYNDLTNKPTIPSVSSITVTLASTDWSNSSQTVTATGVTSSNTVIVAPTPSDMSDYTDAGIVCTAQGTNTLTFECDTAPSSAIDVNVVII